VELKHNRKICNMLAMIVVVALVALWSVSHRNVRQEANEIQAQSEIQFQQIAELEADLLAYHRVVGNIDIRARVKTLQPKLDEIIVNQICTSVEEYCDLYNLNTGFVISLIYRESSFDVFSRSGKECYGLMQVRYRVHKDRLKEFGINSINELYYIDNNIHAGCNILSEALKGSDTVSEALRKYVGGGHKTFAEDIFRMTVESLVLVGEQPNEIELAKH